MPFSFADIIKTSYETGPYRIVDILRGCTCPNYVEQINSRRKLPPAPEQIHLTLTKPDEPRRSGHYFLNR